MVCDEVPGARRPRRGEAVQRAAQRAHDHDRLDSSEIKNDPKFKVFLDVFANPKSSTSPITKAGSANQELFESWIGKWQAGKVSDLQSGLADLDKQIDAQLANATGTQVP